MNVGKVASYAYARRGSVGVDRAAKCPAQNRVSQKHTRFRRVETCERDTGYVGGWDFYEWSEGVAGLQYSKKTESYGREAAKKQES